MFECDVCGIKYKRNTTLTAHKNKAKICMGARVKLTELQQKIQEYEESAKRKEEEHNQAMQAKEQEFAEEVKKIKAEYEEEKKKYQEEKEAIEAKLTDKINDLNRDLWYQERETHLKKEESEIWKKMVDDLKNTLIRQSEIIATHAGSGSRYMAQKKEPVKDITEIKDFKVITLKDLSENDKYEIGTLLYDTDVANIYTHVFKKFYIHNPPNLYITDMNRGRLKVFKNKKWIDMSFDQLHTQLHNAAKEMFSVLIEQEIRDVENRLEEGIDEAEDRIRAEHNLAVMLRRQKIIDFADEVKYQHSFYRVLTHRPTINIMKNMIKNSHSLSNSSNS